MKKIILIIPLFILFVCCGKNSSVESVHEQMVNIVSVKDISDCNIIDDSVSLTPIDTKGAKLSYVSKIQYTDSTIIILDKIIRKNICVFSNKGTFLYNIGRLGNGNKEYQSVWDFDIRHDSVFVLDARKKKVLIYHIQGEYLGSKTIPYLADGLVALENGDFLFSIAENMDDSGHKLLLLDSSLQKKEVLLDWEDGVVDDKIANNVFQKVDDKIFFHRSFDSFVYEISKEGKLEKKYSFDFYRENVPNKYHYLSYDILKKDIKNNNYEFFIDCPIIKDGYAAANCFIGDSKGTILVDIKNGIEYSNIFKAPDFKTKVRELLFPITYYNGRIIGMFDSSIIPFLEDKSNLQSNILETANNGGVILCAYSIK